MGLFDGGMDMDAIMQMLNPMGSAQAAGMPGMGAGLAPDDQRAAGIDALTRGMGGPQPNLGPDLVNPSPVPPGTVPLPRPFPGDPSTGQMPPGVADATRTGLPGPTMNPAAAAPPPSVGAALTGMPIPGAAGPTSVGGTPLAAPAAPTGNTDVSARAKTEEEKRPSLAQALKGVQAPKPPELQKISSPNAPRPTGTIKGGDLQALLMALNAGAPNMQRTLPVTLGRG